MVIWGPGISLYLGTKSRCVYHVFGIESITFAYVLCVGASSFRQSQADRLPRPHISKPRVLCSHSHSRRPVCSLLDVVRWKFRKSVNYWCSIPRCAVLTLKPLWAQLGCISRIQQLLWLRKSSNIYISLGSNSFPWFIFYRLHAKVRAVWSASAIQMSSTYLELGHARAVKNDELDGAGHGICRITEWCQNRGLKRPEWSLTFQPGVNKPR